MKRRSIKILRQIAGIQRGYWVFAVGLLALILSVRGDWYPLPSSALSSFDQDALTPVLHGAVAYELILRVVLAGFGMAALAVLRAKPSLNRPLAAAGWILLSLLLAFPYVINHWYPEYGLDNRVIFRQVDRVVNDMEASLNWRQSDWRQTYVIDTKSQPPEIIGSSVFDDTWGLEALRPEYQSHVLQNVLGYSNEFLNVVGRAWIFGIVGVTLLLLALHVLDPGLRSVKVRPAFWGLGFSVIAVGLLVPKLLGYYYIEQGKLAYAKGNPQAAETAWQRAGQWSPALRYSLAYAAKLGELAVERGCTDCPEAAFYELARTIKTGRYWRAEQAALAAERYALQDVPGFRYWLASIYLEYGIQAFNAGQYGLAEELWQKTLLQLPTAAMAWHGLALVHIKYKQFHRSADELQQVVKLQKFLTFKKLTVAGQYYATKSWAAFRSGDLPAAHRFYSQYLTPESWK